MSVLPFMSWVKVLQPTQKLYIQEKCPELEKAVYLFGILRQMYQLPSSVILFFTAKETGNSCPEKDLMKEEHYT